MATKKINKAATIKKIKEAVGDNIKDVEAFNRLMKTEEDIRATALMWDVEIIYE
jgi:hypothetical protein